MKGLIDADAYPADELQTVRVRVPEEMVFEMDDALELFTTIRSREQFILWAIEYTLETIRAEQMAELLSDED